MFSIRMRSPRAGIAILIIVIIFTVALLVLGYAPETVLLLVAGAAGVAVTTAQSLAPQPPAAPHSTGAPGSAGIPGSGSAGVPGKEA
jgi:hypothetical protein